MATRRIVYRDVDLRFRPHPMTGDVPVLYNEEAVKQVLRNVVLTNHYERFMWPRFGGNITYHLFQNANKITLQLTRDDLKRAISSFVKEAEIISIKTSAPAHGDLHTLQADIVFKMRHMHEPVSTRVFLGRVR